jgi:hypothetical protein
MKLVAKPLVWGVVVGAFSLAHVCGLFGCSDDSESKLGVVFMLYGPPKEDPYLDLDPFNECAYVKLCYRVTGDNSLKGCITVERNAARATLKNLPYGVEYNIVAQCHKLNPGSVTPEPMERAFSKGTSFPILHQEREKEESIPIYMLPVSTFGPVASPPSVLGEQAVAHDCTTQRLGASVVELVDRSVLVVGGVDEFDPQCDDWSLPECVVKALDSAERYGAGTGDFSLLGTTEVSLMTEKRAFAAAVRLPDGQVAIFGGLNAKGKPTNSVEIFSPQLDWFTNIKSDGMTPLPTMVDTRAYHTATLISEEYGGLVLLVGGFGSGEATWEVWGPNDGTILTGVLTESRRHHTATLISKAVDAGSKRTVVMIMGGEGGTPGSATVRNTIEIFDAAPDVQKITDVLPLCSNKGTIWQQVDPTKPPDPDPVAKTMHAAAFVPKRHFIYVGGGFNDGKHQSPVRDICVWNTAQERWHGQAGSFLLKKGRGGLSATSLPMNVVLFAGGLTKEKQVLQTADTVEIVFEYQSPDTGQTVVDIGPDYSIPMLTPRWWHSALATADGKVLFTGGFSGNPANPKMLKAAEVFNPE